MKQFQLNPKDINQPIQLLGASLLGAVLLVGEFLYASMNVSSVTMAWLYGITATLIFPMILFFIFILQTDHRDKLLSDPYYFATKKLYVEQSRNMQKIPLEKFKTWLK